MIDILGETVTQYQLAIDLLPLVSALVAAVAIAGAGWQISRQLKYSAQSVRYEANRDKRATAKALMAEITAIHTAPSGTAPETLVFDQVVGGIGRLNSNSINAVLAFYYPLKTPNVARPKVWTQLGVEAIACLGRFLDKDTIEERDYLHEQFKKRAGIMSRSTD